MYFLEHSSELSDKNQELFELFKNLITNKFFQYLNDTLLVQLSKFILNFSFKITNSVTMTTTTATNVETSSMIKSLGKQQQIEIKFCVELVEKLIDHLTTIECLNCVVLCLCELLDIAYQNQQNRSDFLLSRQDTQMSNTNDTIINNIYEVFLLPSFR